MLSLQQEGRTYPIVLWNMYVILVHAALQALFGANVQAQVAAVAALPPNWSQPAEAGA